MSVNIKFMFFTNSLIESRKFSEYKFLVHSYSYTMTSTYSYTMTTGTHFPYADD